MMEFIGAFYSCLLSFLPTVVLFVLPALIIKKKLTKVGLRRYNTYFNFYSLLIFSFFVLSVYFTKEAMFYSIKPVGGGHIDYDRFVYYDSIAAYWMGAGVFSAIFLSVFAFAYKFKTYKSEKYYIIQTFLSIVLVLYLAYILKD